jgi:hypothetical protein
VVSTGNDPCPKFGGATCPPQLYAHLLERVEQRQISGQQLGLLVDWLDTQPEVPAGKWFKRFPGMIVCGEGEWIKTFLAPGQVPIGDEVA